MGQIIGLTGPAGCGKDTAAMALPHFNRFAFADELKDTVNKLFGWDQRHSNGNLKEVVDPFWGFSPRKAYQMFGTEFGRALDNDLWIKKADLKLDRTKNWIVTDVRFENEANFIRKNGILIHLNGRSEPCVRNHESENGVRYADADYRVSNTKTIDDLWLSIRKIVYNGSKTNS